MVILALALVLTACAAQPTTAPAPISTPSAVPSTTSPETTETLTPAVISSPEITLTVQPSQTPLPTTTFTPIVLFTLPTITATPAHVFDCSLLTQSVVNGSEFDPGARFSVGWQVVNTGAATWYPGTVIFQYFGGSKLHLYPVEQLKGSVPPGAITTLNVDMKAPVNSTTYTTLWSLHQGNSYFCRVRVTIFVREK